MELYQAVSKELAAPKCEDLELSSEYEEGPEAAQGIKKVQPNAEEFAKRLPSSSTSFEKKTIGYRKYQHEQIRRFIELITDMVPENSGLQLKMLDISLRMSIIVITGTKKRNSDGKIVQTTARVGTSTEHYLVYLNNVMNVLDKNDMKGFHLVIDSASIHKSITLRGFIEK
ncbi:hypothetical protein G6F37_008827 [Rhizopus arrhizus]|nr:hypothetical protein G6F38_002410 [Rhizopus arrhizus]KAG1155122.1 hypothetical protein G6F37_008827 [Rhizopus arrhizus]